MIATTTTHSGIWTKPFWKDTAERALATLIQVFLAVAVTGGGVGLTIGFEDVNWVQATNVAAVATLFAVLKALLAGLKDGNPSIGAVAIPAGNVAAQVDTEGDIVTGEAIEPPVEEGTAAEVEPK